MLDALRDRLMQPEHVAVLIREFASEWNRLAAEAFANTALQQCALEMVERKLTSVINVIAVGLRAPGLQQKLDKLADRKVTLLRRLQQARASTPACTQTSPSSTAPGSRVAQGF
jgi:site-specific DNA recombinase